MHRIMRDSAYELDSATDESTLCKQHVAALEQDLPPGYEKSSDWIAAMAERSRKYPDFTIVTSLDTLESHTCARGEVAYTRAEYSASAKEWTLTHWCRGECYWDRLALSASLGIVCLGICFATSRIETMHPIVSRLASVVAGGTLLGSVLSYSLRHDVVICSLSTDEFCKLASIQMYRAYLRNKAQHSPAAPAAPVH